MTIVPRRPKPSELDVRPLDDGQWQLWQSIRHLFPEHANAVQTGSGSIAISWSMEYDPRATEETAAPIVIRASQDLFDILEFTPLDDEEFLVHCIEKVKRGLIGYDPLALFPQVRVITIDV